MDEAGDLGERKQKVFLKDLGFQGHMEYIEWVWRELPGGEMAVEGKVDGAEHTQSRWL